MDEYALESGLIESQYSTGRTGTNGRFRFQLGSSCFCAKRLSYISSLKSENVIDKLSASYQEGNGCCGCWPG